MEKHAGYYISISRDETRKGLTSQRTQVHMFHIPNARFIKDFPYRINYTMEYLLYLYKLPLFLFPYRISYNPLVESF